MSNFSFLGPSFELNDENNGANNSTSSTTLFPAVVVAPNTTQRAFTRYTSDPGMTHSSSSSPPSSPCSLTAIDSSPPSSPSFGATNAAGDDLDLDLDMNLDDETLHFQLGRAEPKVRCVTPDRSRRWDGEGDNSGAGKRKAGGDDLETSPSHPYAASTRGVKRPPMYDKSTSRAKIRRKNLSFESAGSDETSPGSSQNSGGNAYMRPFTLPLFDPFAALNRPDNLYARDSYMHDAEPGAQQGSARRSDDPERDLWDETIANAVDGVESKIDLRCVPNFIAVECKLNICVLQWAQLDVYSPEYFGLVKYCRLPQSGRIVSSLQGRQEGALKSHFVTLNDFTGLRYEQAWYTRRRDKPIPREQSNQLPSSRIIQH